MKNQIIALVATAVFSTACNNSDPTDEKSTTTASSENINGQRSSLADNNQTASANQVITAYLHIKNALASDNGKDAASGGKELVAALAKIDTGSATDGQKKVYREGGDEMRSHGKHINENSDKIDHQRDHFSMLSDYMIDWVKEYGASQTLYKNYCPMFNDGKGAAWVSELKEIKNPYYGREMLSCGELKEEL